MITTRSSMTSAIIYYHCRQGAELAGKISSFQCTLYRLTLAPDIIYFSRRSQTLHTNIPREAVTMDPPDFSPVTQDAKKWRNLPSSSSVEDINVSDNFIRSLESEITSVRNLFLKSFSLKEFQTKRKGKSISLSPLREASDRIIKKTNIWDFSKRLTL